MFELPEYIHFATQINQALAGKMVEEGHLGNSPHKFVWYNRQPDEFAALTRDKMVGKASSKGRWLFIPLEPGYVLVFGECGGKLLYHASGAKLPDKYHLYLQFTDGSSLTMLTQMWGAMELYEAGKEQERQYIKGMRTTPVDPEFSFGYFSTLIDELIPGEKRSIKGLLTQDQLIPGLGNAIAQDIMFNARLHPRHAINELSQAQRLQLYHAIIDTVQAVIAGNGRNDEIDLFNQPGRYARIMDSQRAGQPCPECGSPVEKIQYLGGACYVCPKCQK
jgi:formamidopyrimidine-DNA glycosylase